MYVHHNKIKMVVKFVSKTAAVLNVQAKVDKKEHIYCSIIIPKIKVWMFVPLNTDWLDL